MILADSISVDELLLILKVGLPRAPLPLHLAHRANGEPRADHDRWRPRRHERVDGARTGAGVGARPARRGERRRSSSSAAPTLRAGERFPLDAQALTVGRSGTNDLELRGDQYASAQHARIEPRGADVWVEDDGSTNGTYVNGRRIEAPQRLAPGDVVRIGETELRYEAA